MATTKKPAKKLITEKPATAKISKKKAKEIESAFNDAVEVVDQPLTSEQATEAVDMDCKKACSKKCGCDASHCKVEQKKQESTDSVQDEQPVPDTQPQGTTVEEKPEEERGHIEVHNYNDEVLTESKYYHRFIEARRCAYYAVKENYFTFSLIKKGKDRIIVTLDKHGEPIFFGDEF